MNKTTSWKIFSLNEEAWNSMLEDCANAKESIVLEQFIFVKDSFGEKMLRICAEKAKAGVKVRFLWDAAGSFTFWGSNIVEELKGKGIELVFWRTLIPGYFSVPNFRSWYFRNHRRTLVIDGKIGYTGSLCIDQKLKNWRDTNVRIEGPVVTEMDNAFERMWLRAKKSRNLPPRRHVRDPEFHYVTNYPAPGRRHVYRDVIQAVRSAHKFVYVTTPYFVPTHRLARTLKTAAQRGVDVRIILPESSDHYAVDLGARAFFHMLLEAGVRIFLYSGNMIHTKSIVIDGDWSTVGSMNLDSASLLYNFEANIISSNPDFAAQLTEDFMEDLQDSKEVIFHEWKNRFFLEKVPEVLIRLFRKFL